MRGEFLIAGAVVLFGLAVPTVILLGDPAAAGPGGSTLSAEKKEGRVLFAERCAQCHTLKDAGAVGKVGPSLDVLAPPKALTVNAIKQGRAGKGQMPAQLLEVPGRREGRGVHRGRPPGASSRSQGAGGARACTRHPANWAIPSAVSITLRICREIDRCYDGAVTTPSLGVGSTGSGGPTTRGESTGWSGRSAALSARARQLTP